MHPNYTDGPFMDEQAHNTYPAEYQPGSMPEIFQLIELVNKKLKQIQRETIRSFDLTPPQYFALTLLWEQDERPLKELAAASHTSRATITGIIDTLESKALVTRVPNPDDRRSLLVRLTEQGRALEHTTPTLDRIFASCCAGLEPGEALELSNLLKKLNTSLDF
jgi:DNA-binding MarR family transcriptional regulator